MFVILFFHAQMISRLSGPVYFIALRTIQSESGAAAERQLFSFAFSEVGPFLPWRFLPQPAETNKQTRPFAETEAKTSSTFFISNHVLRRCKTNVGNRTT